MDAPQFTALVGNITLGKKLPDAVYLHKAALSEVEQTLANFIHAVATALKIEDNQWDIAKLSRNEFRLSLLAYPTFFTESYPSLHRSVTVDLNKLSHRVINYNDTDNPPILHRKETMLSKHHQCYKEFQAITQEGENAGLYDNSRMIGFKQSWLRLIEQHGYSLIDGRLFKAHQSPQIQINAPQKARLTDIKRPLYDMNFQHR